MHCLARVDLDLVHANQPDQQSQGFTLGYEKYTLLLQCLQESSWVSAQVFRHEQMGIYSLSCLARVDIDTNNHYSEQTDFFPHNFGEKLTLFLQSTYERVSAQVFSQKQAR
ncbi:hypothetical protein NHP200010_14980 [Helicobacter bizzozeronii]|nr:hypothetical protein [Helicobacter bizzozeronii]GMB93768.1 hypothetical protein NHP200010_14980 [Helicobacter bizzozeronii]